MHRLLRTCLAILAISASTACSALDDTSNSGQPTVALSLEALAPKEAVPVTLSTPCGAGPIVVGGQVFETANYAVPSEALVEEWGAQKAGHLRWTGDDTLSFVPDDSTIRLQFKRTTLPDNAIPELLERRCP